MKNTNYNTTCTVRIEFDAAHRVIGHENKCKYLHGHRYVLEISAAAETLDNLGRVIDFGVLKRIVKEWIDSNLDHTTILSTKDIDLGNSIESYTGQKIYYLNANPTAENIAQHLLRDVLAKLFLHYNVHIAQIVLHETPNCKVTVTNSFSPVC